MNYLTVKRPGITEQVSLNSKPEHIQRWLDTQIAIEREQVERIKAQNDTLAAYIEGLRTWVTKAPR